MLSGQIQKMIRMQRARGSHHYLSQVDLSTQQKLHGWIAMEQMALVYQNCLLREADLVKFAKSKPLALEIEDDRRDAEYIIGNLKPKPIIEKEDGLE